MKQADVSKQLSATVRSVRNDRLVIAHVNLSKTELFATEKRHEPDGENPLAKAALKSTSLCGS